MMRVLIVNPIIYTSETAKINKVSSIKDTMIYDLCLAFSDSGIDVTLAAAEDYKPENECDYPFEIIWLKTRIKKICKPNNFPFCPEIKKAAKKGNYDLIISSEVFSVNSLMLAMHQKKKLIVWHELAKHNNMMHKIPSHIWYGIVARLFFKNVRIVPRSIEARDFISSFCKNVSTNVIDHGVNLNKFTLETEKSNCFAVCSQLIERKQINRIIDAFSKYLNKYDDTAQLYIMGEGDEQTRLEAQVKQLGICNNVFFTGKLAHSELIEKLKQASAMLVYTRKDNNMVSIVESIAVGTPVVTTSVPYNARYIKANELGIVDDNWNEDTLNEIATNKKYIDACANYRRSISTAARVDAFLEESREL